MHKTISILIMAVLLSGCNGLHPYRVDIQQGNVVEADVKAQLRLGMNKSQVNSLLGTPVLGDMFDSDTWIYAYTKQINGGKIEKKKLTLEFENDKLVQMN